MAGRVYVLYAVQQQSMHGIATPQAEIDLIKRRLKQAIAICEGKEGDLAVAEQLYHPSRFAFITQRLRRAWSVQFSRARPLTRSNSAVSFVTSVRPSA